MIRECSTITPPLTGGCEHRRPVGGLARPALAPPRPPLLRAVLVPVDGSPAAEHALPHALALAQRDGAEVTLVGVYSTLQAAGDPGRLGWHDGEYRVEHLRDYLDGLTRRVSKACPVRVRPLLLGGRRPDDALCATGDWGADLVVMAARHRGWWPRLLHASVSAGVARRSRSPVLLVPAGDEQPDLAARPPLGRVLVPLDGSARAERAIGPAAALAARGRGECDLLRIVRARPYAIDWALAYAGRPTAPSAEPARAAYRYLRGVAGRLRPVGVSVRWHVVADGRPTADAIARYAGLSGADVIVLASRGGVAGLFRGSSAVRVARAADVPVLICRTT